MSGFSSFGRGCRGGGIYKSDKDKWRGINTRENNFRGRGDFIRGGGPSSGLPSHGLRGSSRGFYQNNKTRVSGKRSFFDNKPFSKRPRNDLPEMEVENEIDPRLMKPMPEAIRYIPLIRQQLEPGRIGTPIEVISNFYKLVTSDIEVYRYHLVVKKAKPNKPKPPGKRVEFSLSLEQHHERSLKVHQIMMEFIEENPAIFANVTYAFDAWKECLCTTSPLYLPSNEFMQKILVNGKKREFKLILRLIGPVNLSEASAYYRGQITEISKPVNIVLDTVLRHIMGKSYDSFGFRFFNFDSNEPSKLKHFKFHEFIRGFVSTVCRTEYGLALSLNIQTECIISKTYKEVVHFVSDIVKAKEKPLDEMVLNDWQLRQINNTLRGIKIYNCRKPEISLEIESIMNCTPSNRMIYHKEGEVPQRISMRELFRKTHGVQLKEYPLVKVKMGKELPMEWCRLVEKQFMRRMHDHIKEEFVEKKAVAANVTFNTAQEFVNKIMQSEPELMKQFGLQLVGKPTSLYGRVLPAPKQLSCNEDEPFYQAVSSLIKWAVICFDEHISMEQLACFFVEMRGSATKLGLHFGEPRKMAIEPMESLQEVMDILDKAMQEVAMQDVDLFFFALPRKHRSIRNTNDVYNMLKHRCDQAYGIVSQCIDTKWLAKLPASYFDSFLQKVNGKLGGLNTVFDEEALRTLPFDSSRTMIVGVDVNHPDIRINKVESAVAVLVGSYNSMLTKYSASIRVQTRNELIIDDIGDMFDELLAEYHRYNQNYPENIILFRNGVGNSKFLQVRTNEMNQIQRSIYKTGRNIKLTVIVLQMFTKTRFALPQPQTITDGVPNYNVPSGTIVDQYVVDPYNKEFYLVSQSNEHGTSRPTKYIIFRDDLNLSTDQLEQTCFFLCHNSVRTRKVIGCPIAVRYADLCASRTMKHIDAQRNLARMNKPSTANPYLPVSQQEQAITQELNILVKINDKIKNLLYYC